MHFTALVVSALPVLAAATAIPQVLSSHDCDVGNLQCCQTMQTADLTTLALLGGLLGLILPPITSLLGMNCSGINLLGISGTSCSAQPVCCSNNTFGGLISLGCTLINISL